MPFETRVCFNCMCPWSSTMDIGPAALLFPHRLVENGNHAAFTRKKFCFPVRELGYCNCSRLEVLCLPLVCDGRKDQNFPNFFHPQWNFIYFVLYNNVTWSNEHTINFIIRNKWMFKHQLHLWNTQLKSLSSRQENHRESQGDKKGKKNGTGSKKIKMEIKYLFG